MTKEENAEITQLKAKNAMLLKTIENTYKHLELMDNYSVVIGARQWLRDAMETNDLANTLNKLETEKA